MVGCWGGEERMDSSVHGGGSRLGGGGGRGGAGGRAIFKVIGTGGGFYGFCVMAQGWKAEWGCGVGESCHWGELRPGHGVIGVSQRTVNISTFTAPPTLPPYALAPTTNMCPRSRFIFLLHRIFTGVLVLCVCRHSCVQPTRVDQASSLPRQASHRLVPGHPAVRPHLRRHSLRAGPSDPPRRGHLQAQGVPGSQRPCPKVPGPPALRQAQPGGDHRSPLDAGGHRHPQQLQPASGGHSERQPRLRITV